MAVNVDKDAPRLKLPLPNAANFLQDDVERLIQTIDKLDEKVATIEDDGTLTPAQVPANVVKVDKQGKVDKTIIPDSFVQTDATGHIASTVLPNVSLVVTRDASSESTMLASGAKLGDICHRIDVNKYFQVVATPSNVIGAWAECPPSAVYSVNGQTGNITGVAMAGDNADITSLKGLKGPLTLTSPAVGDNDAVTYQQLKQAAGTMGQGPSLAGVMNDFIGSVEWYNGPRSDIAKGLVGIAGYMAADGQLVARTDVPDIVAAMKAGLLNVVPGTAAATGPFAGQARTSDQRWQVSDDPGRPSAHRSAFSWGDGDENTGTTIRLPDLNGRQLNSLAHLFLSGSSGSPNEPSYAQVWGQSAPNLYGETVAAGAQGVKLSGATPTVFALGGAGVQIPMLNTASAEWNQQQIIFNANLFNQTYGRGAAYQADPADPNNVTKRLGDLYPSHAVGIWVIRVNGNFSSAGAQFHVIAQRPQELPDKQMTYSGFMYTDYQVAGQVQHQAAVVSAKKVNDQYSAAILQAADHNSGGLANFEVHSDGLTVFPLYKQSGSSLLTAASGAITFGSELFANFGIHSNPGMGVGVKAAESNLIELNNSPNTVGSGGYVNWVGGTWYNERFQFGATRSGNTTMDSVCLTYFNSGGNKQWYFGRDGYVITTVGKLAIDTTSDRNKKHDIVNLDGAQALANIERMQNVQFVYNNDPTNTRRRGFIAQQLQTIDRNYVAEHRDVEGQPGDRTFSLNNGVLLMDALAAIGVLSRRVKELEAKL